MARWLVRHLVGPAAVLVSVPVLTMSLPAGVASASGAGQVTLYPGLSDAVAIATGPDGALWFTGNDNVIGRITTNVTPPGARGD